MTKPKRTLRSLHCPACRTARIARELGTVNVNGRRYTLAECTDPACELVWATRPALGPVHGHAA